MSPEHELPKGDKAAVDPAAQSGATQSGATQTGAAPSPGSPSTGALLEAEKLKRVLTVPNVISLVRLLCVPVFLFLLFGRDNHVAAAWLLAVLGATDWVDGYIARRFDQVTTLGKVLDPTADRLLLGVGVISILVYGSVPAWIAVPAVAREVLVGLLAVTLAALGAKRIDVSFAGKCGTFAMMVAFPLFLVGDGSGWMVYVAYPASIVGLVIGWYSAAMYVPQGRQALREGRAEKALEVGR